jgi:hypothetical protein
MLPELLSSVFQVHGALRLFSKKSLFRGLNPGVNWLDIISIKIAKFPGSGSTAKNCSLGAFNYGSEIMPRGAKPGERRGSRRQGSKNKLTLERYVRSTQVAARQKDKEGPKLGKEVIEDLMNLAMRNAIACQPTEHDLTPSQDTAVQDLKDWKRDQFREWASLAVAWASELAPYQSATYRAISKAPQPDQGDEDRGTTVIHTIEDLKAQLMLHGVSPDQLGRALLETIEHDDRGESDHSADPAFPDGVRTHRAGLNS